MTAHKAVRTGNLGYQSEYTDSTTGRVNMLARWYNTATGQFDTRDTMSVSPVPDSIAANRFQYGDANPSTNTDPTGHFSLGGLAKSIAKVVSKPVAAVKTVVNVTAKAVNYVASGQAWNAVKKAATVVTTKAKKAYNVVKETTTRYVKQKVNTVKDAVSAAKKCVSTGVAKCAATTVKTAAKAAVNTVKSTVETIKQDPWKFVASAAVAIAATVAVGALCATGIGCLILAGAAAGAMAAGGGYMVDVAQGEQKFSLGGLASTMIEGGLDGALSAGLSRLTGPLGSRLGGGGRSPGVGKSSGPSSSSASVGRTPTSGAGSTMSYSGSSARPNASGGSSEYQGRHRAESCHSFDPETQVLLAGGTTKAIKDIAVGERVVATDPTTGETAPQEVTRLHVNTDEDLTDVTVRDDASGETSVLKTTDHHPFWDATERQWVDAAKLKVGHRLLVHDDERLEGDGTGAGSGGGGPPAGVTVVEVESFDGSKVMRDLTVANTHTYYVIAGTTPVLVHNCTPVEVRSSTLTDTELRRPSFKYQAHVMGSRTETTWRYNDELTEVDGDNGDWLLEAKWTGNDAQWDSSPYNPNHKFYDPSKTLDQTRRLLDLAAGLDRQGVVYAVSNKAGADHLRSLLGGISRKI
ncbi:polymorphic toxin-type HINT domain-containing protein [Micromonospora sp. NPDC050397]|uniref:polymorphic toxin-type HINT domain-containing protein n=1 Tax=Micromonospora sp. NPDC050397 TaxID=3364279 RepID=UPI00384C5145